MRNDRDRLRGMAEAVERIEKYASRGRGAFDANELIQTWVIHHIQVIGEACRGLSDEFRQRHRQTPWAEIIGMRHILVHRYFGIDRDAVWAAVEKDLPELKRQVQQMLDDE